MSLLSLPLPWIPCLAQKCSVKNIAETSHIRFLYKLETVLHLSSHRETFAISSVTKIGFLKDVYLLYYRNIQLESFARTYGQFQSIVNDDI